MSYTGSKRRLGNRIYNVISDVEIYLCNKKLDYFEPFMGVCGVLKYFSQDSNRICYASDLNKDLVLMWKALQSGWKPPCNCNKEKYNELKNSKKHSAERGFIGIACSYGGIFFVGYRSNQRYGSKNRKSIGIAKRGF